jgi:anthranilate phosphoribosyltransferase
MDAAAAIAAILAGRTLAAQEAESVMHGIADGLATPAQIGALLALLQQRGATVDEIAGFARVLRARAVPVRPPASPVLDTCGTGGDGAGTLNISTLAALVAAAGGVAVAKHGNRSVSSRVGSADLLEALGVRIDLDAEAAEAAWRATGFVFLYAPLYHPALKHAAAPRRELGVRTVFNILGPLANPAGADHQLLGVYADDLVERLAEALQRLGTRRALVVHGADGTDEISCCGPTRVAELQHGRVVVRTWQPLDAGVTPQPLASLRGGDLDANVKLARRVLGGEPGPLQDAVALNAGAALYVAGAADAWWKGVAEARRLLVSGAVRAKLEAVVAATGGAA